MIGPRDLPKAFHTVGKWVRAAQRVTADFQRHVDDMMRETELEDLRKVASQASSFNVKKQIENVIDPGGELKGAFDIDGGTGDRAKAAQAGSAAPAPGPSVPIAPKPAETASEAGPAPEPAKAAAKPKAAAKSSGRVPSRVPKKRGGTAAKAPRAKPTGAKSRAAKAPSPEKTS